MVFSGMIQGRFELKMFNDIKVHISYIKMFDFFMS